MGIMTDKKTDRVYAIVVAGGKGARFGTERPKQLLAYGRSTVLDAAVFAFASHKDVDRVIIVSPDDGSLDNIYAKIAADCEKKAGIPAGSITITQGAADRQGSVRAGLRAASEETAACGLDPDYVTVLIHDAARPGVSADIISRNIEAVAEYGAVCTALPASDSMRMIIIENEQKPDGFALKEAITYPIMNTGAVRRDLVYRAQTPQSFRLSDILEAHEQAVNDGFAATDDASVAERAGMKVVLVEGSSANNKITTKEDIRMSTRTGIGYDVHRLVPGRDLILCGTPIPSKLGLDGHSDADVAVHALMDALLGAAGLGDIGRHFPDTDDRYKGADSMKLLAEVRDMLGEATVNNADITIIAQAPKLAPYIEEMRKNISGVLGIPVWSVNVKATTEEGLGFTGRGEGIAAMAAVSIEGSF